MLLIEANTLHGITVMSDRNKYHKLVIKDKLKLPFPFPSELDKAVDKDIFKIAKTIANIEKKGILNIDEGDLHLVRNLMLVKKELEKVKSSYLEIISEIDRIWTHPILECLDGNLRRSFDDDESRIHSSIYTVDISTIDHIYVDDDDDPYRCFLDLVNDYMENTYSYLGEFGSFDYTNGDDFEVLANHHPWYNEITETSLESISKKATEVLKSLDTN